MSHVADRWFHSQTGNPGDDACCGGDPKFCKCAFYARRDIGAFLCAQGWQIGRVTCHVVAGFRPRENVVPAGSVRWFCLAAMMIHAPAACLIISLEINYQLAKLGKRIL